MPKIQLYSLATPNGQKVGIALEEMELDYDAHLIDISKGEQFSDGFVKLNPNSKIPVILDPNGPHGAEHTVFESGAILWYLAEKSGKFLSHEPAAKSEALQWLFFQIASIGPMFGQFGHFYKYAKEKCDHPYPLERYTNEAKRLLGVLEHRLEGRDYILGGDYSIVDMATFPWVNALEVFYEAGNQLELKQFPKVMAWRDECLKRPAVKKGMKVCSPD